MNQLEFPKPLQKTIQRVLAAILHLGNLELAEKKMNSRVTYKDRSSLQYAAELLEIDEAVLENALTARSVSAGMAKTVMTPLKENEALYARDAFCKAIYSGLFARVVKQINDVIVHDNETIDLGLLDIYGFEVFEINSFEQLCINWTNEKLQQVFIELTLKQEQEEYIREGIEWTPVEYFNN